MLGDMSGDADQGANVELGRPHRGALVFAFGLLAWLTLILPIFGALAWAMGTRDLHRMRTGEMDPAGEGITRAGRMLGMAHLVAGTAVIFLWYLVMLVAGALIAAMG